MTAPHSTNPATGGIFLTPTDVERLLKDDSPDSRVSILEKVSAQYNTGFGERERVIAEQIFRMLMKDATLRVRETLAQRLKENPDIPRDVALHMANDVDSVALPVLQASPVLSDADLVTIIEASRDMSKLMVISQRENVSERVSDALVETSYPQVVNSLLQNGTAKISTRSMEKIIDDHKNDNQIIEAMMGRKPLAMTLVERLIQEAGDAVATQLKAEYNLTDAQLRNDISATHDDLMLRLLQPDISEQEIVALIAQLAQQDRLTASLVMTSLCRGQLTFFTAALAHYSSIPYSNAAALVNDKGNHGFQGLYRKSGLPDSMFEAIRMVLKVVKDLQNDEAIPGSLLYANRMVQHILREAGEDADVEYLPYFIALIRQNIHRH